MDNYFSNKTILVTGATSGIGYSLCQKLAAKGASLILLGRKEAELENLKNSFANISCLCVKADLEQIDALSNITTRIFEQRNRIDGFAYCAGQGLRQRLRDTSPEYMLSRFSIHCLAFVELTRLLSKNKKKSDLLQIVSFSSLAARGQDKYLIAYAASKAAMEAAARTMAAELITRNVLINIVRCAFVDTPMITGPLADPAGDFVQRLQESGSQPLGIIPPEIAAEAALYLLGPGSLYSTGTIVTINAGAKI